MTIILTKDLVKIFRSGNLEVQALRGLNIEITKGEMVALIGPSGSGKTTLLNIIGGIDCNYAGSVQVLGTNLKRLSTSQLVNYRRFSVGYIFQSLNLIPTLTAAENIELPLQAVGIPKGIRRSRTLELLDIVGLLDRAHHKPKQLSGGEQQRVAIAMALANDPSIILADEPTGELDTVNARTIMDFLSMVNRDLGKTILMVTHDPDVSRRASRILHIQDGKIVSDFSPTNIELKDFTSYEDILRRRISQIEQQKIKLEENFRRSSITLDFYLNQYNTLENTKSILIEELDR